MTEAKRPASDTEHRSDSARDRAMDIFRRMVKVRQPMASDDQPLASAQPRAKNIGATITVEWGYEPHTITLTRRNWARVKAGKPLRIRGNGYYHEGEFFWDHWDFAGGIDGRVLVEYGRDGGVGFDGHLSDAIIEEMPAPPRAKNASNMSSKSRGRRSRTPLIDTLIEAVETCVGHDSILDPVTMLPESLCLDDDQEIECVASTYREPHSIYLYRVEERDARVAFFAIATSDGGIVVGWEGPAESLAAIKQQVAKTPEGWTET